MLVLSTLLIDFRYPDTARDMAWKERTVPPNEKQRSLFIKKSEHYFKNCHKL